jgi:uridine kinase
MVGSPRAVDLRTYPHERRVRIVRQLDVALRRIDAVIRPHGVRATIVAIDGLGGSGKSTLAALLAEKLGAQVIHTDDFASWDNPLEWWPRLREEVLVPLGAGRPARFQRYDWEARELTDWQIVVPDDLVLLEGVSSSRNELAPYLSIAIWVEATAEVRLRRGLERDGRAAEEQWREWMRQEDEWVEAQHPKQQADLVLDGESPW